MHRRISGWLLLLVACGGRARVEPAPSADATAPPPSVPPPVATLPVPPPVAVAAAISADSLPAKIARDSAADAALLDTLETVEPAASLPELSIDAPGLRVEDFADQPRVKYYLDYFTGRAHDRFQIWLDRMGRYESYARKQFTARNLPGDFVYLGLIESGFSPGAVSRSAAVGMWQFMVATGRRYGLRADSWVDERRDPIKATDAAAQHLAYLTERFGSPYLAAAAYNAGAGRVQRGLGQLNAADDDDSVDVASDDAFFSLADANLLRDETRNYVPQLIAATILAKQPDKYGFQVDRDIAPFPRDSVMVDGGTGLDLIARLADTTLEAMHDLNPQLLRMVTPPDGRYFVRVPAGRAKTIAAAYAVLAPSKRHAIAVHDVKRGETVAGLARKYGAAASAIRSANRSARGRSLKAGTRLYIPVSTTIPVSLFREPDPPRSTRSVVHTYIVRRNETLTSVARRAGVSVSTLRAQNHLSAHAMLRIGQRLRVRKTVAVSSPAARTKARGRTTSTAAARTRAAQGGAR